MRRSIRLMTATLLLTSVLLVAQEPPVPAENESDVNASTVPSSEQQVTPRVGRFLPVIGLENWEYTLDISDYPDGKYNLVARGIDNAGNEYTTEAIDVTIDAESDRPTLSVTNPSPGETVRGNLNILGTAIDDDAIETVSIRIGDEYEAVATGTDYWSYYLDTESLPDGEYEIHARATDIGGIEGNEVSISFHLDNQKPLFDITSHANGELVNDRITIGGVATDRNGIAGIKYGTDRDKIDNSLRFSSDKSAVEAGFELKLDTRDFEEGAQVLWFEAVDKTGSTGTAALLLFVDNEAPEIEILSPTPDQSVNGAVTIVGAVRDAVGVFELTAQSGDGEPEPIELSPGNPYWSKTFDFTGMSKGEVVFSVTDRTGNLREERFTLALDTEGDRPEIRLSLPATGTQVSNPVLAGFFEDDDKGGEVIYRIDRGEEHRVPVVNAFTIPLDGLSGGEHTVFVHGIDSNGIVGEEIERPFVHVLEPPEIVLTTVSLTDDTEIPFVEGMVLDPRTAEAINGSITFANPRGEASYRTGNRDPDSLSLRREDDPGRFTFSVPLDRDTVPYGFVTLQFVAEDGYGRRSELNTALVMTDLTTIREPHGIYLSGHRAESGGPIPLNTLFSLRYVGFPLADVFLEPASTLLSIGYTGDYIEIRSRGSGITEPVRIVAVSDRGTRFTSGPFVFATDSTAPTLTLANSDPSGRISGPVTIAGIASDDVEVATVTYRTGDRTRNLTLNKAEPGSSFETTIPVSSIEATGTVVEVTVTDTSGNSTTAYRTYSNAPRYVADPEAKNDPKPTLSILSPTDDSVILPEALENGSVYVSGIVTGVPRVGSIAFSLDDGESRRITPGEVFEFRLPGIDRGSHQISLQAYSDLEVAGNTERIDFVVAGPTADLSVREIVREETAIPFRPGMELRRTGSTTLSGTLGSGARAVQTEYRIDGNEPASLRLTTRDDGSRRFTIPIRTGLSIGRHDISIVSTDEFDREVRLDTFFFLVEPVNNREVSAAPGLYLTDSELVHTSAQSESPLRVQPGAKMAIAYIGRPIDAVRVFPESPGIEVIEGDNRFDLQFEETGLYEEVLLEVETVDGDIHRSNPVDIIVDSQAPSLALPDDLEGAWFRDWLRTSIEVSDDLAVTSAEAAIRTPTEPSDEAAPSPRYKQLAPQEEDTADGTGIYQIQLDLALLPDGPLELWVRATDASGMVSERMIPVVKDATPPGLIQITPPVGTPVNGLFSLVTQIVDSSPIVDVGFSDGDEEYESLAPSNVVAYDLDLASYEELPDQFVIAATDAAGNTATYLPALSLDLESDRPSVDIQLPEANTVLRNDFVVSGMVFDDDAVAGIRYRIDDGDYVDLAGANSFEIEISLEDITDNQHAITFEAYDLGGVRSRMVTREFMVSKADPVSQLSGPSIESTNRGIVTISGESFDANGVSEVFLSFDNGNTYNRTVGTDSWRYTFDSRTLLDGTYSLLIRAIDTTGGEGLFTSLLNVDNTRPELALTGLADGQAITDSVLLQGNATDTIGLREVYAEIEPFDRGDDATGTLRVDLDTDGVLLESVDVSTLEAGWYNLRLTAVDRADNVSYVSRDWRKIAADQYSRIDILFPAPGEPLAGEFAIQGRLVTTKAPEKTAVYIDGNLFEASDIDENGYFHTVIAPELLQAGTHTVRIEAALPDGTTVSTNRHSFSYLRTGPWVRIDTFSAGAYASDRPWVSGRAGFFTEDLDDPEEDEARARRNEREIIRVEYSLDNGRTFDTARGDEAWRFRLETLDLPDEPLNIMVRATFRGGEQAVAKTQVVIDDTAPMVTLASPQEGMRFNDSIDLSGTAYDASGLREVAVQLRRGGKGQYEVPSFIQGLYVDGHFLGATTWEGGVGLTFFDDSVKLQVQIGAAPPGRFSGFVVGAKLLASIALLPYSIITQDLAFLSSSIAIGAAFNYFTMSEGTIAFSDESLVLAAVIGQVELLKLDLERVGLDWPVFKSISAYTEAQLWFISSDVEGGVEFRLAFGMRSEIF